jgi:hypothetical protein
MLGVVPALAGKALAIRHHAFPTVEEQVISSSVAEAQIVSVLPIVGAAGIIGAAGIKLLIGLQKDPAGMPGGRRWKAARQSRPRI